MNKIVIIGGGVAGLSTGIFLQKKGFSTVIYEKNKKPGGMCCFAEKNGFRFDLSCRYIDGIKSGHRYRLMTETGAAGPGIAVDESAFEIYRDGGETFRVEWNPRSFRTLLENLSEGDDNERIERFFLNLQKFREWDEEEKGKPFGLLTFKEKRDLLIHRKKYASLLMKCVNTPLEKWISEWKSPSICRLWRALYPDHYSLYAFYMHMAARLYGNSGFPRGGAAGVVDRLTAGYLQSGGELLTGHEADEIIINSGKVTGVKVNGRIIAASTVIAACDFTAVLGKLLRGRVKVGPALNLIRQGDLYYPLLTVCYGLRKQYEIPSTLWIEDERGVDGSPDLTNYRIEIHSSEMSPGTAPAGKSAVIVNLRCDYFFWKNLKEKSEEACRQYELMVTDELNACLDRHFPGFSDSIETTLVCSPLSYEAESVLYRGSWRGFAPTTFSLKHKMPHLIRKCRGLFFCGQSIAVGGGIGEVTEDAKDTAEWVAAGLAD